MKKKFESSAALSRYYLRRVRRHMAEGRRPCWLDQYAERVPAIALGKRNLEFWLASSSFRSSGRCIGGVSTIVMYRREGSCRTFVRGWFFDLKERPCNVSVCVDGRIASYSVYGLPRGDVEVALPGEASSLHSGFVSIVDHWSPDPVRPIPVTVTYETPLGELVSADLGNCQASFANVLQAAYSEIADAGAATIIVASEPDMYDTFSGWSSNLPAESTSHFVLDGTASSIVDAMNSFAAVQPRRMAVLLFSRTLEPYLGPALSTVLSASRDSAVFWRCNEEAKQWERVSERIKFYDHWSHGRFLQDIASHLNGQKVRPAP